MPVHWRFLAMFWPLLWVGLAMVKGIPCPVRPAHGPASGQLLSATSCVGGGQRFWHRDAHGLRLPDIAGHGWHTWIGSAQARWRVEPGVCARWGVVVNFGEVLEMWTKKRVVATPHRVVGGAVERMSVPLFYNPNASTNVALVGLGKVIRAVDHLQRRFDETYLHLKDKR